MHTMDTEVFGVKEFEFLYNNSKGKLIELAIEKFLLKVKADVRRIGVEHIGQGFLTELRYKNSSIAQNLKMLPDFLVRFPDNSVKFIEVKYRGDGNFDIADLLKYIQGVDFIIVSEDEIFYLTSKQVDTLCTNNNEQVGKKGGALINLSTPFDICDFLIDEQSKSQAIKALNEMKQYVKWLMPQMPKKFGDVIKVC
jgi:hypothetical protein